jgi:hypothetical protein
MTNVVCVRAPAPDHPAYLAARAMLQCPPLRVEEVFQLADFGPISQRLAKLNPHIDSGWLQYVPGGRLIVSQFAVDHFNKRSSAEKFEGSLATPRENVHAFTPLSPKHRLNPRGTRADAWDNSTRAIPSHHAKVNP